MKKRLKQILSALLVAIMLVGAIPLSVSAAYENTYANTGNQRDDIIGVAKTQLGYKEGANNATKYGTWYGLPNQPWCAMFISWCARQAGISTDILKNSAVAAPDAKYFNIPYYDGASYTPKKGDLFFTKSWSHVGLVYYVDGSYFYTIEGNSNTTGSSEGTSVVTNRRKISNFYFGVPKYQYNSVAPTYAKISTDKLNYAVDEPVNFTFESDGDLNNLWVYCPDGSVLTYKDVGTSYELAFGMSGFFEGLVQTWNGVGNVSSQRISWYVGKPQYSYITVNKKCFDLNEKIEFTFDTAARGDCNTLWIYKPDGSSEYYQNVGNSFTISFSQAGSYEALVEAWNDIGSCISEKVSFVIGKYEIKYNVSGYKNQTKYFNETIGISSTKPTGKSFTVTYNANGGTVSTSSKTVSQTFTNWNTAANGSGTAYNAGATYSANANVTLYAQYANPSIGSLPTPTRSGYGFDGWYTAANGGTKITDSTKVTANTTVYAHWKANAYTVSYNVNGGTGSIASQTKTHGTNLTLTTAKPTGKSFTVTYNANGGTVSTSSKTVSQTFTNWNTAANGSGTAYNAGATYSANANVTLYAQYANPSIGSLPTPTRSGYGFDGWYTAANGGTKITDSTKVTANTTVYAHWKANAYTVSYNVNGGTGSIASQTKTHGTNLTLTTAKPTGKSFTVTYNANGGTVSTSSKTVSQSFTNWNTAANGSGTAYNAGATYSANANVTLYAQYANPSIGSLPTPTRSGYAFDGWYSSANGGTKIIDSTKVTANTTVYAHWKANAYTVSYNVNGGTGSIASQTKTHGTNLTLTTAKPTGKSFTVTYNANGGTVSSSSKTVSQSFTNWNTAANGSGTAYNAGATYSANANVILYAQYANPSIGSLPTPTRSGYAFDGWYTAANGGTKITDTTKVTANTTVYAHWIKNSETKAVVRGVKIDHNATFNYKSTYMLSPEVKADNGAKYTIKYESSNTKVATVGEDGKIYGAKKGNATITCTVTDNYGNVVKDSCNVNVEYSTGQWLIIILLFGWIWYI